MTFSRLTVPAAVIGGFASLAAAQTSNVVFGVLDPAAIKLNGKYYIFSTGNGIPIRVSDDLKNWKDSGRVMNAPPAWAVNDFPGNRSQWAPDVTVVNGEVRLYFAVSEFGKSHSTLGLFTSPVPTAAKPDFQWTDRGQVISTQVGDDWNAIDSAAFVDADGRHWMAIGSYWSGIKLFKLDAATGKVIEGDKPRSIAARGGSRAIEAPFVTRHDGWYFLWVSFDRCCAGVESTYNVRIGRSRKPDGPYVDRDGKPMTEGGGTLVLEGYDNVRGPGHNSVLQDGDKEYLVHHWYDAARRGRQSLGIRPITYDAAGWPKAGEPLPASYTPSRLRTSRPATGPTP